MVFFSVLCASYLQGQILTSISIVFDQYGFSLSLERPVNLRVPVPVPVDALIAPGLDFNVYCLAVFINLRIKVLI